MRIIITFCLLFAVVNAQAEIVFAPAFSYFKFEDEDATGTAETEITNYDIKLGYVHTSGLYLGGMYQKSKINEDESFAVGPTLGYNHYSGFYALFTYFILAEQEAGSGNTFTDGMGPQIDLGWVFPINYMFLIGPQISYRSIAYDKFEQGGSSADADFTRSFILPSISLWFRF